MKYEERLQNPLWQKRRLEVLERDDWTCQYCRSTTKSLQVHHVIYEPKKDPWDHKDQHLITLCKDCHGELRVIPSAMKILYNSIRKKGFKNDSIELLSYAFDHLENDEFDMMVLFYLFTNKHEVDGLIDRLDKHMEKYVDISSKRFRKRIKSNL